MSEERWRDRLLLELAGLEEEDASGSEDQRVVTLDQQSVGRLSRMDAMQRQAMAQATQRRREARRTRLKAALLRVDEGEFGFCLDCGEAIPPGRIELDPAVALCVECARG
jgi:DnaK suppressor protein